MRWPAASPRFASGGRLRGGRVRFRPALGFATSLSGRTGQDDEFRTFPADFFLDNFAQRDVRDAHLSGVGYERATDRSGAGVELADAAGNEVYQDVGIADFLHGLFYEFSVHDGLVFRFCVPF